MNKKNLFATCEIVMMLFAMVEKVLNLNTEVRLARLADQKRQVAELYLLKVAQALHRPKTTKGTMGHRMLKNS